MKMCAFRPAKCCLHHQCAVNAVLSTRAHMQAMDLLLGSEEVINGLTSAHLCPNENQ